MLIISVLILNPELTCPIAGGLDSLTCSHLSVLTMCVSSPDFKAGKARGLSWNLLNSFKTFIDKTVTENVKFPAPALSVADEALRRLARQPNPSILRLGCEVFQLELSTLE